MNNDNSNDSIPTLNEINLNYYNQHENEVYIRFSERRNAIKPYIPPNENKNENLITVKKSKKSLFKNIFCCYQ